MLRKILFSVLAIIVLALVYAFFAERNFTVMSEVIINKSKQEVFDYTKNLHNQEKWSKWVMADPKVKLTYSGADGAVGSKVAWVSDVDDVGIGEQEIMNINGNTSFDQEIRFKKPFEGISKAIVTFDSVGVNLTKVTTSFKSENPFPMNLMIPIVKSMLQKDMDQNAANLKGQLEK
jgi:hypothetical protein